MPNPDPEVFRISRRILAVMCCVVAVVASIPAWSGPRIAVIGGLIAAAYIWIALTWMTIAVHPGGIVLYRFYRVSWDEIIQARRWNLFGLNYLVVSRRRGLPWFIPLYYWSRRPMIDALIEKAPPGSVVPAALRASP